MSRLRRASYVAWSLAAALIVSACAVAVRSDRAAIGGGPAQATAQAQVISRTTVVALATANAGSLSGAVPCECDSTAK